MTMSWGSTFAYFSVKVKADILICFALKRVKACGCALDVCLCAFTLVRLCAHARVCLSSCAWARARAAACGCVLLSAAAVWLRAGVCGGCLCLCACGGLQELLKQLDELLLPSPFKARSRAGNATPAG